ncbi:hypothetical protein [Paenibacillus sp. FSL W7-1287]|uniref:hypothetical protein n=1 Tax=Paenibacillus sp. FSL W7-1287 TaxID=2954538 RepID=UPI0030FA6CB3
MPVIGGINITDKGKEFLERHYMIGQINIDVIFNSLTEAEVIQQIRIFGKLIENVEGMSDKILAAVHSNMDASMVKRGSEQYLTY